MSTISTSERVGVELLKELANDETVTVAERLVAEGRGVWIDDPEVDGVVGLVHTDDHRRAWLAVWVEARDFETGIEFEEEAMR